MMVSRLVKLVWLVLAIAGSAGLILWMSEHGDLTRGEPKDKTFDIVN